MQSFPYPERVTLCEDGHYRWSYKLSREQSRFYYRKMVKICAIVGGAVTLVTFAVFYEMLRRSPEIWWFLVMPFIGIVGLPALIGHLVMNGGEVNRYEMDEECIRHKNAAKGGDAWVRFSKIQEMTVDGDDFDIKEGITTYRIHVPTEDVAFVKQFIEDRYN